MSLDKNALAAAIALHDAIASRLRPFMSRDDADDLADDLTKLPELRAYLTALPTTSVSEPVAWRFNHTIDPSREPLFTEEAYIAEVWGNAHGTVTPLYAHPAPSEPVSDLVRLDGVTMTPAAAANRLAEAASALTAAEARAAEAEKALEALERNCVPLSADGRSVFIDGTGDVDLDWKDERLKRAEAAEARIAELEHRSLAEGWRPIWDVQEFKIWDGIDPTKAMWHGLGYACSAWYDAAELMEFLFHNDPSLLLRVAPSALPQPPEAK